MKRYYKKGNKSVKIIVIALLAVLTAVCGGIIIMERNKAGAKEERIKVYVLASDVKAGDMVKDNVVLKEYGRSQLSVLPDNRIDNGLEGFFKISLHKNVILTRDMIESESLQADDVRLHNYPFIELTDKIEPGDYVDVRISFNDGSDYILLAKKRVYDCSVYDPTEEIPNSLWMEVDEEEILRLSSAAVDAASKEDCRLYAIKYISQLQKEAQVTYPVNSIVSALILGDPNIAQDARKTLEERLNERIDKEKGRSAETGSQTAAEIVKGGNVKDDVKKPGENGTGENGSGVQKEEDMVMEPEHKEIQFLD